MIALSISCAAVASSLLAATRSDLPANEAEGTPSGLLLWAVAAVLIAAGAGAYYLVQRSRQMPHDNARALLRDLCRSHHLSRYQSQLLKRLAAGLHLDCPSALFVDSTLWQQPAASTQHRSFTEKEWQKLQVVRSTVFMPATVKPKKPTEHS